MADTRGLTDSALPKIVRIAAVTLGAQTDLKLFLGGVFIHIHEVASPVLRQ